MPLPYQLDVVLEEGDAMLVYVTGEAHALETSGARVSLPLDIT